MSKPQSKTAQQRRPIRSRKRKVDPNDWLDELEMRLSRLGASTCDLPGFDPRSYMTEKQHQHALRVRARFLVRRIREIEQVAEGDDADRLFADLMDRAALIDDGPAWFEIEKRAQKSRSPTSEQNCAC